MANGDSLTNSFDSLFTNSLNVNGNDLSTILSDQTTILENIESQIKGVSRLSQGQAQSERYSRPDWRNVGRQNTANSRRTNSTFSTKTFTDGLEKALLDAIGAGSFKQDLQSMLKAFSDDLGVEISDIPHLFGKELGQTALAALKQTSIGKSLSGAFDTWKKQAITTFKDTAIRTYAEKTGRPVDDIQAKVEQAQKSFSSDNEEPKRDVSKSVITPEVKESSAESKIVEELSDTGLGKIKEKFGFDKILGNGSIGDIVGNLGRGLGKFIPGMGATAGGLAASEGAAVAGGSMMAGAEAVTAGMLAIPGLGEALLAMMAIEAITSLIPNLFGDLFDSVGKVGESFGKFTNALSRASNRDIASREARTENANARFKKDIESIIHSEFKILEDASNRMIAVWEDNLKIINQTQGYSKAELQDLISGFATRIRSEGLSSVVSASDFTENLGNVLRSGLSGKVAEEFAYIATRLNAAIPTQDFFQYTDTYASLIGNAIKDGKSQSAAIQYANEQLELFASDVLYASRQLSGGLNVGLQNASDLFKQATEISIAAKTGDPSRIAGVLTSVAAITGAIAPDLASSIVDAVYGAATGGNSSQIVALRSLAGINASNTEFLQKFASDPQSVFSTLFENLANMQNMSQSNYMEVAEGLSNVFGLSMDAFSRVDFNYLAQAINNMNVSTAALDENMTQLASGESTLSAEQMRIRQINEYMIDEGLSYVLDNEVARSIQEHMWEEQLANQIMEAEYSVDIKGSFAELVNNIYGLINAILDFLIPFRGIARTIGNLAQTSMEGSQQESELRAILAAGNVGSVNAKVFQQLTRRGIDLKLTNSYLDELVKSKNGGISGYSWGTVSKSLYNTLNSRASGLDTANWISGSTSTSSVESSIAQQKLKKQFDEMVGSMSSYFGSAFNERIESEINKEKEKLAKSAVSESEILARAQEYLKDPERYGLGFSEYSSKLSSTGVGTTLSKDYENRVLELAKQRAEEDIIREKRTSSRLTASTSVTNRVLSGEFGESGYEAWKANAGKFGLSDYSKALTNLGYSESDIKNYFESLEAQEAARSAEQRNQDEEFFWSESQRYLNLINSNIHDVFDKGDIMGILWPGIDAWMDDIDSQGTSQGTGFRADVWNRLTTINDTLITANETLSQFELSMESQWSGFRTDWSDYYIKHTTYTQNLTGSADGKTLLQTLDKVKNEKDKTTEDVLNALTEALISNPVGDLLDPTVQQNMFLAMILQAVQTIVQQNNTQGKLKLPDAISALATGMTAVDSTAASSSSSAAAALAK